MLIKYLTSFILLFLITGCGGGDSSDSSTNFSLSGNIFVGSNTARDDDVNDIATRELPNNNIYEAQSIPNPVILGGYVNQTYTGHPDGRFYDAGDWDDFFAGFYFFCIK